MADGFEQLKRDLKLKNPGRFYIFHGEEAYLRSVYLQRLKDQILDELTQDFNFHRFTAENVDPQALLDAVEALPMMAQRSMVQIDDVDFFAQNEDNRTKYASIFGDLPDYCTVVLVYETVSFKPDKRKKALAQALERASVVEFTKPAERELIRQLALMPAEIETAARLLDPSRLTKYTVDLAAQFHKFYDSCKVRDAETPALRDARLLLCNAVRIVLGNTLGLLKVTAPERM